MDSAILDSGGANSGALSIETTLAALPDDLRIVTTAWEFLRDDARRSILAIIRRDAERNEASD